MKPSSILTAGLGFIGTVCAYNSTGPVTYLGEPEPLWSGGASAQGLVYTGGTTGLLHGEIVSGGIKNETAQTLRNMAAIFEEAETSWSNVLKVTVFLANMSDFDGMNEVYRAMVPDPKPGRTTVEISAFAGDFLVEIEAIAAIPYY